MSRCTCPRGDRTTDAEFLAKLDKCVIHGLEATAQRIGRSLGERYGGPFDIVRALIAGKLQPHEQAYVGRLLTPGMVAAATAAESRSNAHIRARATEAAGREIADAIESAAHIGAGMAWDLR